MKRRQLKNKPSYNHKLNRMSDETYKLRRKVMDCIYRAKKMVDLPRIEVRIVSGGDQSICGYAYLNQNIVHINEKYATLPADELYVLVLHEIVHAVTGFKHDNKCYLMNPFLTRNQLLRKARNPF